MRDPSVTDTAFLPGVIGICLRFVVHKRALLRVVRHCAWGILRHLRWNCTGVASSCGVGKAVLVVRATGRRRRCW